MKRGDDNIVEFRLPNNPRRKKMMELRLLLKEKERAAEQKRLKEMRKQWKPKIGWGTVLIVSVSIGFLLSTILLSAYAALK